MDTYSYQIVRWKGADAGVTGRIGCFSDAFAEVRGYHGGLHSNGYEDLDLLNRLGFLILDQLHDQIAPGKSFKQQLRNSGAKFHSMLKQIADASNSLPKMPLTILIADILLMLRLKMLMLVSVDDSSVGVKWELPTGLSAPTRRKGSALAMVFRTPRAWKCDSVRRNTPGLETGPPRVRLCVCWWLCPGCGSEAH